MEAPVIIDPETYYQLKDLMGADYIPEVIDTYIVETGDLIERMGQAMAQPDAAAFGRIAHSIKSSSASLGALAFSQQARDLEMMGKANDLTGAVGKLEKLTLDFMQVKQRLETLKNEP